MSSPELLDQTTLTRLCKQVESGKWATTYLFTGKELTRKKDLAIAFAKALNCQKKNSNRSCDCVPCKKIDSGNYPDVKWYGADEEASSIKISEVRDFKNWLNLKPFEGKVKVFIFNEADRLTAEAQNALLKSIEEPPPGNVIIFLVPHAKSLFDTISSRSVEIKVSPFSQETIQKILIQGGTSREEAEFLARMSQGELSRAQSALETKWFQEKNKWIDQLTRNPVSFLENVQGESRAGIVRAFDFLIEWFRDLLVFKASGDSKNLIHADRIFLIEQITASHDFESILELFESLSQIKKSVDEYANQKLVLTQAGVLLDHFFKP